MAVSHTNFLKLKFSLANSIALGWKTTSNVVQNFPFLSWSCRPLFNKYGSFHIFDSLFSGGWTSSKDTIFINTFFLWDGCFMLYFSLLIQKPGVGFANLTFAGKSFFSSLSFKNWFVSLMLFGSDISFK